MVGYLRESSAGAGTAGRGKKVIEEWEADAQELAELEQDEMWHEKVKEVLADER